MSLNQKEVSNKHINLLVTVLERPCPGYTSNFCFWALCTLCLAQDYVTTDIELQLTELARGTSDKKSDNVSRNLRAT
jgi:hypothetical protein